jgi:two-component system chemotaxis sensor kinase CheA
VAAGEPILQDHTALREALAQAAAGAQPPLPAAGVDREAARAGEAPAPGGAATEPDAPAAGAARVAGETIRVTTHKLDDMIRLMGEVVSQQNKLKQRVQDLGALERAAKRQVEQLRRLGPGTEFDRARSLHAGLKELLLATRQDKMLQDALTTEFQEKALQMRMVPLAQVFDSLPRLARDLAASLGKEVDFVVEGGEIELDKKMVEQLGDPLLHLLRNALDHGIEAPAERERAGKPPQGRVRIGARQEGDSILIELSDDGAGISLALIREKALARKMFDAEALDGMDEAALVDLIFQPGFSTSRLITDVSGRGVGMDVVKRNIVEDLKGTVAISTREGRGSVFAIRLPLTLAIMRMLLVSARGRVFGIAAHYVIEMLKVPADEVIAVVTRRALRLREEFVPVVDLAALLTGAAPERPPEQQLLVIVIGIGSEKVGFVVDAIPDEEDLVIKSLPDLLRGVPLISGVTVSGRSQVVPILNVPAVLEAARTASAAAPARASAGGHEREIAVLVVDDSINTREIERDILEAYGYRVTIAGDGVEALEQAAAASFDLVITDVEMPRLNGFVLTERLRADPAYRDVPIIIVTSREKDEDKRRGIEVGASAYIVKGAFEQSNLVETVQNLVGRAGKP